MLHDINTSHNCSISFINADANIQLVVATASFHFHSGPSGHTPSFNVDHPTSSFEVILLFHSLPIISMENRTTKVLVSYKNGTQVAFAGYVSVKVS